MRILVALLLLLLFSLTPALADVTNASSQQIEINAQTQFGLSYSGNTSLMNYVEPGTTTSRFGLSTTVFVAPSTTDQQINLATLFPFINSAQLWGMQDISNPGQQLNWGLASGGQRFQMNPGGFFECRVTGSAPILYIDNPSSSSYVILKVFCIAN